MTTSSTSANSALSSLLSGMSTTTGSSSSSASSGGSLLSVGQINVSTLVSELMTIQSQPLVQVQNQESSVQAKLSAYGQEQSALSTLQSAAQALSAPSAFNASSATVTGSGVSAVVTGNPAQANYSVAVNSLATTQSIASATQSSAGTALGTGTLTLQLGTYDSTANTFTPQSGASAITVNITSANDTLSGIAGAINAAAKGSVNASVVTNGNGSSQLVLTSANTGAANGFTVTASSGLSQFSYDPTSPSTSGMTETQAAADASFSVNGLALTSASNSVTTAISGVTLNLTQAPATGAGPLQAQVSVGTDSGAISNTINSFVSAYNSYISLAGSLTAYNATTKTASELTGDPTTNTMVNTLQSILGGSTAAAGTSSSTAYLAQIGITASANGSLSINSAQLQQALQSDPSAVAAMFTGTGATAGQQGFAVQVSNTVQNFLSSSGALGSTQQGLNMQLSQLQNKATMLQSELNQEQTQLLQEYSQLNATVTAAQAQQAQMANELAGLPG